jgi:hypothetical protein
LNGFAILTDNAPLPIELVSFEAYVRDKIVELRWTTKTETNNDYFTLERTADGKKFEFVSQIDGAGSSSFSLNYQTWDVKPYNGLSYYRLKQTDFNGKTAYSSLVPVNSSDGNDFGFELYLNPGDGSKLSIETVSSEEKETNVVIMDAGGKKIYSENIIASNGRKLNDLHLPAQLTSGIYMVGVSCGEKVYCKKFVVQ